MKAAHRQAPVAEITDELLDQLVAVQHWEALGPELDALIAHLPAQSQTCERTTTLTWLYQQQGVMSFTDVDERVIGMEDDAIRKRHVRAVLRGMEKLLLVNLANFPLKEGGKVEPDGFIGRGTLVSLTWSGMIWLRRAWQARARLAASMNILLVHQSLVEEEDDGKGNEPYWVENISNADPEGTSRRFQRITQAMPTITSVFDLGLATAKGKRR